MRRLWQRRPERQKVLKPGGENEQKELEVKLARFSKCLEVGSKVDSPALGLLTGRIVVPDLRQRM